MGKREGRRLTREVKAQSSKQKESAGGVPGGSPQQVVRRSPQLVATGRISAEGRETYVTFESMSEIGQAAVRRVFGENVRRAEEIANA